MFSVYSKNKGIGLTVPILLEESVYTNDETIIIGSNKVSNPSNYMVLLNKTVKIHNVICLYRGAATDSGLPGQHIHSGPPAFRGVGGVYGWGYGGISPSVEIAIVSPSPSFFPLLPNQIILFQLLKLFSFVCNGKVIIFCFGFL